MAEPAFRQASILLVQLEIPLKAVESAIQLAAKHRISVILNPAPARPLLPAMLEMVDYLTPNETETAILAGSSSSHAKEVALTLKTKVHVKNIIVTLGKDGALITGYRNMIVPGFPVSSIDTTGAGDAFNGGLAVALARGDQLAEAVRFANPVAALSTTCTGAQPSLPALAQVKELLELSPNAKLH